MSSKEQELETLVGFVTALREAGLKIGVHHSLVLADAVSRLGPESIYWAGRCTTVARREELQIYDDVFQSFWGIRPESEDFPESKTVDQVRVSERGTNEGVAEDEAGQPAEGTSGLELLRRKDFGDLDPEDIQHLHRLMRSMLSSPPMRPTRRRSRSRSGELDLRRTLRRSVKYGGVAIDLAWRNPGVRQRRVIFLLDVSGSMKEYSRALLLFAHAARQTGTHWEAFCFGTRLTRVTRDLSYRDPHEALRAVTAHVEDWEGGTRIGGAIGDFITRYGHRGMARGSVVVICSDGLESGDPTLLGEQMARLSRLTHATIWLNPLKSSSRFQPLARGMKISLPYIDVFGSGHNLASLELLTKALAIDAAIPVQMAA